MANVVDPTEILAIIQDLGTTVTLQTLTGKTYNPATGDVTETGAATETGYITPPEPYNKSMGAVDNIVEGSLFCYLAASGLSAEPVNGYNFTFDSKVWKIISVSPVYVGDDVGLYLLQVVY